MSNPIAHRSRADNANPMLLLDSCRQTLHRKDECSSRRHPHATATELAARELIRALVASPSNEAIVNRILHSENLAALRTLAGRKRAAHLHRPALQHRHHPEAHPHEDHPRRRRRPHRLRRQPLPHRDASPPHPAYTDTFDDYLGFLRPRLDRSPPHPHRHRLASSSTSTRAKSTTAKSCWTKSSARDRAFQNEIIWAYDYGARSTKRWPAKHDNILWYTKHPDRLHLQPERDRPHPLHGARVSSAQKKPPAAKPPPTSGGTPSSPPPAKKKPATPRRSRSAFSSASSASTPTPATPCSTSSPAAEPQAKPPHATAAAS